MVTMDTSYSAQVRAQRDVSQRGPLFVLPLFILAGVIFVAKVVQQSATNTAILFVFAAALGVYLCQKTAHDLKDHRLVCLSYFWLAKLAVSLFLLYAGWMPMVSPDTPVISGYDPIRYYYYSQELIDSGWRPDSFNLNYMGVLYYYGAIFALFGRNPVTPALINSLLTLFLSLYLVKTAYEIKPERHRNDWLIGLVLLMPELLWYDVITSRETVTSFFLLVPLISAGRYLAKTAAVSLLNVVVALMASTIAIAALRTSMLLPFSLSMLLMLAFLRRRNLRRSGIQRAVLLFLGVAAIVVGPIITRQLGGYEFDLGEIFHVTVSASRNVAASADMSWSDQSIGMLLLPEGVAQSILFVFPRMLLYLIAPLPYVFAPFQSAYGYIDWQSMMTLLSSIVNVFMFPMLIASFYYALRGRLNNSAPLMFHIIFWPSMLAIAGGNLIIHERYRIMATPVLWGAVWLGFQMPYKRWRTRLTIIWYGVLTTASAFYVAYKFYYR